MIGYAYFLFKFDEGFLESVKYGSLTNFWRFLEPFLTLLTTGLVWIRLANAYVPSEEAEFDQSSRKAISQPVFYHYVVFNFHFRFQRFCNQVKIAV